MLAGLLVVAAKYFHVPVDEREIKARACLPGANCGACGYTGWRVNPQYAEMLANGKNSQSRAEKEAATFVRQKLDSAKWFVEALRQRQNKPTAPEK